MAKLNENKHYQNYDPMATEPWWLAEEVSANECNNLQNGHGTSGSDETNCDVFQNDLIPALMQEYKAIERGDIVIAANEDSKCSDGSPLPTIASILSRILRFSQAVACVLCTYDPILINILKSGEYPQILMGQTGSKYPIWREPSKEPTAGSKLPITSGGVWEAIQQAIMSVFHEATDDRAWVANGGKLTYDFFTKDPSGLADICEGYWNGDEERSVAGGGGELDLVVKWGGSGSMGEGNSGNANCYSCEMTASGPAAANGICQNIVFIPTSFLTSNPSFAVSTLVNMAVSGNLPVNTPTTGRSGLVYTNRNFQPENPATSDGCGHMVTESASNSLAAPTDDYTLLVVVGTAESPWEGRLGVYTIPLGTISPKDPLELKMSVDLYVENSWGVGIPLQPTTKNSKGVWESLAAQTQAVALSDDEEPCPAEGDTCLVQNGANGLNQEYLYEDGTWVPMDVMKAPSNYAVIHINKGMYRDEELYWLDVGGVQTWNQMDVSDASIRRRLQALEETYAQAVLPVNPDVQYMLTTAANLTAAKAVPCTEDKNTIVLITG